MAAIWYSWESLSRKEQSSCVRLFRSLRDKSAEAFLWQFRLLFCLEAEFQSYPRLEIPMSSTTRTKFHGCEESGDVASLFEAIWESEPERKRKNYSKLTNCGEFLWHTKLETRDLGTRWHFLLYQCFGYPQWGYQNLYKGTSDLNCLPFIYIFHILFPKEKKISFLK